MVQSVSKSIGIVFVVAFITCCTHSPPEKKQDQASPQNAQVPNPCEGVKTASNQSGSATEGETADAPDAIRKVVEQNQMAFEKCYNDQLQKNPDLSGGLCMQWQIGSKGKVSSVSTLNSTLDNEKVESCVANTLEKVKFEGPESGQTTVTYPFTFGSH